MSKVVVVGSLNIDLITEVEELPREGQTIIGKNAMEKPGGKGANQAVAIGKLNSPVCMIGKVGMDTHGDSLIESLRLHNVDTSTITQSSLKTGFAFVSVDKVGKNQIVVVPGANYELKPNDIWDQKTVIEQCEIVVLQLEIPIETVKFTLKLAKQYGKITVLNPAPSVSLDSSILKNVDILIPNEHELFELTGVEISSEENLRLAGKELLDKGAKAIVVTLGGEGCCYLDNTRFLNFPAHKVEVKDTTAAGDSFIGGFVSKYLTTKSIEKAIERAQAVAAITVTRLGSQSSIPTIEEVNKFSLNHLN